MSVKLKVLTAIEDDSKTAILCELPNNLAQELQISGKEFLTIEDLITVCDCIHVRDEQIDWMKMIFDPTLAVDPKTKDKTEV